MTKLQKKCVKTCGNFSTV